MHTTHTNKEGGKGKKKELKEKVKEKDRIERKSLKSFVCFVVLGGLRQLVVAIRIHVGSLREEGIQHCVLPIGGQHGVTIGAARDSQDVNELRTFVEEIGESLLRPYVV